MVYINENSKIVSFPKSSNAKWDKVHFVNQTTHVAFDLFATDTTNNDLVYNIDISSVIDKFEVGQYDYSFQENNGTVICSGIIQFDSFTPNTLQYTHKTEYIQYTPEETYYPEATSTIYITENDTYNVEDYNTAVVNVAGGGNLSITSVFGKGLAVETTTKSLSILATGGLLSLFFLSLISSMVFSLSVRTVIVTLSPANGLIPSFRNLPFALHSKTPSAVST